MMFSRRSPSTKQLVLLSILMLGIASGCASEPDKEMFPSPIMAAPAAPDAPISYDGLRGVTRNPMVSHVFTADPSAKVFEGRVYVYASHDLDDQENYDMTDYHVFSSSDLVNWQDHGVALDVADVSWASKLYAPDAAYSKKTGKYYLYFPDSGSGIGVAVSDNPGGPFVDALGEPLINKKTPGVSDVNWVFDPMCFVDDDGQAYLYFGGGMPDTGDNLRVIRLNEDMISIADASATTIVAPDFFEAAFVHKRNGVYYLSYSTHFDGRPIVIDYLKSDNPMTGFQYAGTVLPNPMGNGGDNNHQSIVEYEGKWYIFYHNRVLSSRDGFGSYQRSITLSPLTYDAAGNIEEVAAGVSYVSATQVRPLDASETLEAETMADQRGIEIDWVHDGGARTGVAITDVHDTDWIGYSQVDFGNGKEGIKLRVASASAVGGKVHIYVDGSDVFANLKGSLIGTCIVRPTGGPQKWHTIKCGIRETAGVHDLYLRFAGEGEKSLFSLDWFELK